MAYVSKETAKNIREALKKEFPECRFSVAKDAGNYSLTVSLMKSPHWPDMSSEMNINQYHVQTYVDNEVMTQKQADILKKIDEVIREAGNYFDDSDPMTDYFHTAFYYHIKIGKYGKPHQHKEY